MRFANPKTVSENGLDVLVIDDDTSTCRVIERYVGSRGFSVMAAQNGFAGIHAAREHQPRVVLLDIQMPGMDGVAAARMIRTYAPNARVVLMSGYASSLSEAGREASDVFAVLEKPLPLAAVADFVRRAAEG